MPDFAEVRRLDKRIQVTVSGILILILFLNTIPLTSASENKSERDHVTYVTIENYSPGDFILSITDNDGDDLSSLTRSWVENTYENTVIENFLATRQVVDHYEYKNSYHFYSKLNPIHDDVRRSHMFPGHGLTSNLESLSQRELDSIGRRDEDFWLHTYMKEFHWGRYDWLTEELESNPYQEWDYGFQVFQGFGNWRRESVRLWLPGWWIDTIYVPHSYTYLYKNGSYKIPVYENVEYTRWRTTTYQIKDHAVDNWPELQTQITLTGIDGYDENVQLTITTDNELLNTTLENQVVHVGSTATTNLTISPQRELHGSIHTVTVTATDQYGRVKSDTYQLDLQTTSKPPVENTVIIVEESDLKPDQNGGDPTHNPSDVLGVKGRVSGDGGPGVDNPSTSIKKPPILEGAGGTTGNRYRYAATGGPGLYGTKDIKVRAKASKYDPQKRTTTDSWESSSIANLDFNLQPSPYS